MRGVTLKDFCSMQSGIPVSGSAFTDSGNFGVVQIRDIDAEGNLRTPLQHIRAGSIKAERVLRNGDVLLKSRGPNITAALIDIDNLPSNIIASSAFFILRTKTNVLLPGFLAWYLNNARLPVLQSMTMLQLHIGDLKDMPVHFPELEVQQQVIDAHKLIEESRTLSDQYHQQIGRLLKGAVFNKAPNREGRL